MPFWKEMAFSRLGPFWAVIAAAFWSLSYFYLRVSKDARDKFESTIAAKVFSWETSEQVDRYKEILMGFVSPLLIVSCLSMLILTKTRLPIWRTSWVNKACRAARPFQRSVDVGTNVVKENQFGVGESSFDAIAFFLIFLPSLIGFLASIPEVLETSVERAASKGLNVTQVKLERVANLAAQVAMLSLAFFLIPVARHSVLLAVMGWSPVSALRIHIWAGIVAYSLLLIHGTLYVAVLIGFGGDMPFWNHFLPPQACWARNAENDNKDSPNDCNDQYRNLTGLVAIIFFAILWVTSLNWFRRHHYRLFYICHVTFGALMLITGILHYSPLAIYTLPSLVYYWASTTPTLIQALALRFRGGVQVRKIVQIPRAMGCVEVHIACSPEAAAWIQDEPCMYIKLCVPKISLIWHPFTVYSTPQDPLSMRFLFRVIGPFTKDMSKYFTEESCRPVLLADGFYRGPNRCDQAMQHDHVTIVAGGVALTPFLSLLFCLVQNLRHATPGSTKLKSIAVHWVCREEGLIAYIQQSYLNSILIMAKQIECAEIIIHIHHTTKSKFEHGINGNEALEFCNLECKDAILEKIDPEPCDEGFQQPDRSEGFVETPSGSMHAKAESPCTGKLPRAKIGGCAMEVAHQMPGRYVYQKWMYNVPMAMAFSSVLWICFYVVFSAYNRERETYIDMANMAWATLRALGVALAVSTFWEVLNWFVRRFGRVSVPARAANDKNILKEPTASNWTQSSFSESEIKEVRDVEAITEKPESHNMSDRLVMSEGRPEVKTLMEEARKAKAPGIFMCGPTTLTQSIWNEVHKENSYLGRTRYCVYDEPFTM